MCELILVHLYLRDFIKIGSFIQKLLGGIHIQSHTHRQKGDLISLLLFFQNKEIRVKKTMCVTIFTVFFVNSAPDFIRNNLLLKFYRKEWKFVELCNFPRRKRPCRSSSG
jgi:hypothetical protein